ncbi:probable G-protein coupled receptor Mth-like 3 [Drosophila santomea]|uniref:probable G-protein coupled receptor Mth-like 3 n=1 Tax=Drosophila santomea TaxID=129105 RepID=UPI001954993A|nr:probable G-protein coupled receptor Mth-like 3 [Drosophila santomea]XP_039481570.1 probable G-protein coupled receptor Mth-like 3 [Drosophila santomea]XP_039481571.1 probable G-protein coupled receptor Mth-like 3 [Drosophila santomea]
MRVIDVLFIAFVLLMMQNSSAEIPGCDFYDTVDISKAQRFSNGSYLYEGLLIPAHLTAEYDFKLLPDDSRERVASHVRGCACQLRPCIRFCCPQYHKIQKGQCFGDMSKDELDRHDPFVNVTLNDGSVVKRHFKEDIIVQSDLAKPECSMMYFLNHQLPGNNFTLFENASLLRHWDNVELSKREYCVQHISFKNNSTRIAPNFCPLSSEPSKTWKTVAIVLSLICLVLTISVYLYVKELRNLVGKCLICYLAALFLGYLFLILNVWNYSSGFCVTAGFLGYFSVMAAFYWLSVISLTNWIRLSGTSNWLKRFLQDKGFLTYNFYAWGMALLMTGITFIAEQVVKDEELKPRVGVGSHCWIYTGDMSVMIYLYGPMLLIIIFNIVMFVLTAIPILKLKKNLKSFAQQKQQTKRTQNSDLQQFTVFLRLFIIMGLSWSMEIISYSLNKKQVWAKALLVADYINWSQGTIIFVIFICKPTTLKLIIQGPQRDLQGRHHHHKMRSNASRHNLSETAWEGTIVDPNGA